MVPELPDDLHTYIARMNIRVAKKTCIQWVKQNSIIQCVIKEENESKQSELFKTCVRTMAAEQFPQCLPFSIDRTNVEARNWQLRLAMNDHASSITNTIFSDRVCKGTKTMVDDLGFCMDAPPQESFHESIQTQFITFHICKMLREVPCKAYLQSSK